MSDHHDSHANDGVLILCPAPSPRHDAEILGADGVPVAGIAARFPNVRRELFEARIDGGYVSARGAW